MATKHRPNLRDVFFGNDSRIGERKTTVSVEGDGLKISLTANGFPKSGKAVDGVADMFAAAPTVKVKGKEIDGVGDASASYGGVQSGADALKMLAPFIFDAERYEAFCQKDAERNEQARVKAEDEKWELEKAALRKFYIDENILDDSAWTTCQDFARQANDRFDNLPTTATERERAIAKREMEFWGLIAVSMNEARTERDLKAQRKAKKSQAVS